MELTHNIISLFDVLGLIQGVTLGLLLIFLNRRNDRPTVFLGLFIIAYALELVPSILSDLNILFYHPEFFLPPCRFNWLIFPLFYLYIQKVSILSERKLSYFLLYPGLLVFILEVIIFFQSPEVKQSISAATWYVFLQVSGIIYSVELILGYPRKPK